MELLFGSENGKRVNVTVPDPLPEEKIAEKIAVAVCERVDDGDEGLQPMDAEDYALSLYDEECILYMTNHTPPLPEFI